MGQKYCKVLHSFMGARDSQDRMLKITATSEKLKAGAKCSHVFSKGIYYVLLHVNKLPPFANIAPEDTPEMNTACIFMYICILKRGEARVQI